MQNSVNEDGWYNIIYYIVCVSKLSRAAVCFRGTSVVGGAGDKKKMPLLVVVVL